MTDWKELEVFNGITYHKYPDEPVNGVVEYHYKNGQQNIRKSYKDGNLIRDKEFQDGKLTRGTTIKSDNKHLSLNEQYYRDELF